MNFIDKYWQGLLIVGLMAYIVISGNMRNNSMSHSQDRIDSILRVIQIPEKKGNFQSVAPQPIIITIPSGNNNSGRLSEELLSRFKNLEDDNAKTRAYAKAIALKVYRNTYKDSTVSIVVKDSIEGGDLKNQDVSWKVKPQKVKYHEKTITKYPKYAITAGFGLHSIVDSIGVSRAQLYPTLGYRGKNGWAFNIGANVLNLKEFKVEATKDIFVKYNKNKKIDF